VPQDAISTAVRKAFNVHRLVGQSCVLPSAQQRNDKKVRLQANLGKCQVAISRAAFALIQRSLQFLSSMS
jgi:hypothetical protein